MPTKATSMYFPSSKDSQRYTAKRPIAQWRQRQLQTLVRRHGSPCRYHMAGGMITAPSCIANVAMS
jgi:hypothetical protein